MFTLRRLKVLPTERRVVAEHELVQLEAGKLIQTQRRIFQIGFVKNQDDFERNINNLTNEIPTIFCFFFTRLKDTG